MILSVLDPVGSLKWMGAERCPPELSCGVARPLLVRAGPDGGGLFLSSRPLKEGKRVLSLSPEGVVVGVGTGWGGRLVHLRGLGSASVRLAVVSPMGWTAVLAGEGDWGRLLFRPGEDPVEGWVTSGDAKGTPAGWPVGGEEREGLLALEGMRGGVGIVWLE